jgi:hypothetical protein
MQPKVQLSHHGRAATEMRAIGVVVTVRQTPRTWGAAANTGGSDPVARRSCHESFIADEGIVVVVVKRTHRTWLPHQD